MKLFLTSSGFMNTSLEKGFFEMVGNRTGLKVAVVPTAGDPIEWVKESENDETKDAVARLIFGKNEQHENWLRSYEEEWKKRGCSVIIADLKEDPAELRKKLESVDVIDVTGGDVNWLLDWAKKSKLDTYLQELLDKGVVYVGTSAGSGIINPDIGLTWWEPKWTLDHVGLGVVDFIVVPHQKESDDRTNIQNLINRRGYLQTIMPFPWKIYLLQDGQAIKVDGEKVEHVGEGAKLYV